MKRKLFVAALLGACCNGSIHAQCTITGKVVDAENNEPVAGATVRLRETNIGCTTDDRGAFTLRNVPEGNHVMRISRLDYGKKYCKESPTVMEDKLQAAIVRAVNKFNEQDNATYKALMRATISEALGLNGDPEEVDMLERKVEALNKKMLELVNESILAGEDVEAHENEFMTLSQEAELLKQRIAAIQDSANNDAGEQSRLEQIQAIIAERESKCMEYDDAIVRQMVECIKVYPGGKLEIIFGGGYLVEESV